MSLNSSATSVACDVRPRAVATTSVAAALCVELDWFDDTSLFKREFERLRHWGVSDLGDVDER